MEDNTIPTKEYFFYYSHSFSEFLVERKIDGYWIKNDSDVLVVRLQGYNDTCLAILMMEYADWLITKSQNSFEFKT